MVSAVSDIHAEDRRLLAAGDYARLFATYRPLVLIWVKAGLARDLHAHAEDVCQDVFVRLMGELSRRRHLGETPYRDRHGVPIPFRVAVRLITRYETRGFAKRLAGGAVPDDQLSDRADPRDELADWAARTDVRAALARLPERTRRVCELALLEDMAAPDIALRLGITENNVYQRLHQGLKMIQEIMGAY